MPRVVPSQVVSAIDKFFQGAKTQTEGQDFILYDPEEQTDESV